MAEKLPPVPRQAQPIDMDSGFLSRVWDEWLQKAFNRMGGSIAPSNTEIDTSIASLRPYLMPSGGVIPFAGSTAPAGWLTCDGAAVSRTTYAALFAAIGTAHGVGDGSTTFNLPDYRGRFLRGQDAGAGRDPDKGTRTYSALGGAVGDNVGSVQDAATARPANPFTTDSNGGHGSHWAGTVAAVQSGAGINALTNPTGPSALGAHTHLTNGGGDSETRPINVYVNYLVKT